MATLLQQLNEEISDVVESVWNSLAQVRSVKGRGAGAGTIWHKDGLVLTNAHVVQKGPMEVVLRDGRKFPAKVIAQDTDLDVAALSIDAHDLPTMPVGESKSLKAGQLVLATGHPWGVVGAVAAGVVIGIGEFWPNLPQSRREMIAVDLNLRPGNSGGPLTDAEGRLIGINTLMTGPEVGLAVPVHVIKRFLKDALGSQMAA
ncbi:MAG: trypsin-like peptidase domain-containing protein [Chloroflexi bacterium]|nr:trypsin-like peptidase domain-containing protein [Chloroflexota bacterium]